MLQIEPKVMGFELRRGALYNTPVEDSLPYFHPNVFQALMFQAATFNTLNIPY